MSDRVSFSGSTGSGANPARWRAWLLGLLLVAFVGVAIVKPWTGSPSETVEPSPHSVGPSATSAGVSAHAAHSPAAPGSTYQPVAAFTTPVPPPAGVTWTGLRWRRVASADPLRLVTSVVRWSGGYLAIGSAGPTAPDSLIWTSVDGAHWRPLRDGEQGTRPALLASRAVALGTEVVVLSASVGSCSAPCTPTYTDPVTAWTSSDGLEWVPHVLPSDWLGDAPVQSLELALGPAGLEAAAAGPAPRLAVSPDGSTWRPLPAGTLPVGFTLGDLVGMPDGYLAVGRWTSGGRWDAASLESADGIHWAPMPSVLPASPLFGDVFYTAVVSLIEGAHGLLAVGLGYSNPATIIWWRSGDGRQWQPVPLFAPLKPSVCRASFCALRPDGAVAGDGERLIALRGGPDAAGWTSTDGHSWGQLAMSGDIPSGDALAATLLPGGVLLSEGATTWYGQAEGR